LEDRVKLAVGLGNPGGKYARSRHNLGFMVIDALAGGSRSPWSLRCDALVRSQEVAGRSILLAKPQTYMNLSGRAVRGLLASEGWGAEVLVVVSDDFNLPFGRIRIRERGSAGGHNGLISIIGALGTEEFLRLRLGVGEPDQPDEKTGFVLSRVPEEREQDLAEMVARARDAVQTLIAEGVAKAMSVYNALMP